ncbi:hypothetical protein CYMTET_10540, partial [Cymbomonas tetramitiformis]
GDEEDNAEGGADGGIPVEDPEEDPAGEEAAEEANPRPLAARSHSREDLKTGGADAPDEKVAEAEAGPEGGLGGSGGGGGEDEAGAGQEEEEGEEEQAGDKKKQGEEAVEQENGAGGGGDQAQPEPADAASSGDQAKEQPQQGAQEEAGQAPAARSGDGGSEEKDAMGSLEASGGRARGGGEAASKPEKKEAKAPPEANPLRDLGDALRQWRERLEMAGDSAADPEQQEAGLQGEETEFEFAKNQEEQGGREGVNEGEEDAAMQTLGSATEEQAAAAALQQKLDRESAMDHTVEEEKSMADGALLPPEGEEAVDTQCEEGDGAAQDEAVSGEAEGPRKAAGAHAASRKKGSNEEEEDPGAAPEGAGGAGQIGGAEEEEEGEALQDGGEEHDNCDTSYISLKPKEIWEEDGVEHDGVEKQLEAALSDTDVQAKREELERMLEPGGHQVGEVGSASEQAAAAVRAQGVWQRCEQLTNQLSVELAEQLRLVLEPTLASRLQGDYRTGKRLNMRKIIPYIASEFRKDKIWLRRTKPSKRKYQVVLAIDDSKSMAERRCGHAALEAMTLLCRAMARLDVGEVGIVSFGETGNVRTIHDLQQPFSDVLGPGLVGHFRFQQENTLADHPVSELLECLQGLLEGARARTDTAHTQLQQLVLVLADGHFHEKERLKKRVRDLAETPGVLVVFIALDSKEQSLLELKSVAFANGKPTLSRYMDSFPFPYYILLQDIAALPSTVADLLRQWFELTAQ